MKGEDDEEVVNFYVGSWIGISGQCKLGSLDISVNGNHEPADSEYTLMPSQILTLDIHVNADIVPMGPGEGDWILVCNPAVGTIAGGVAVPYGDVTLIGPVPTLGNVVGLPAELDGVAGSIILFGTTIRIPASTILFNGIIFHCEDDGTLPHDVVISLERITPDWEYTGEIYDQVIIHQIPIPEPMTLTLLGLGGLLLRRRK